MKNAVIKISFILGFFFSTPSYGQKILMSLGMNYNFVSYKFQYNSLVNYPYNTYQVKTYTVSEFAIGPSFRMWYSHGFGERFDFITGAEACTGLIPGDGSLLNGFLIEIPIYAGGNFHLSEKYSLFSTLGFSYVGLRSINEMTSVFANLEAGLQIHLNNYSILLKARYGKLFYQHYSENFPFEQDEVLKYKGNLIHLGFAIQF